MRFQNRWPFVRYYQAGYDASTVESQVEIARLKKELEEEKAKPKQASVSSITPPRPKRGRRT